MIAAERTLLIRRNGESVPVQITVDCPVQERGAWVCNFSIGWPGSPRRHYGMGVDSVQALKHALTTIAVHLYASPYHKDGSLEWEAPGTGYGFPLPAAGRDLAIGDDKQL